MTDWAEATVALPYRLGERRLWSARFPAVQYRPHFLRAVGGEGEPAWPFDRFPPGVQLVKIPSLPVPARQRRLALFGGRAIRYVPSQYHRYYVEIGGTFDDYLKQFSGKTRSTLRRKVKKYLEFAGPGPGGGPAWREYRRPDEMAGFHALARDVARRTYQERLGLQAAIPDGPGFVAEAEALAAAGAARGYALFHGDRPTAYLFCPVVDGAMLYQHVGHDPEYEQWSPGTVLLFLVLERLFAEGEVRYFDFTEGEGAHKESFANRQAYCADILYLRRTPGNLAKVAAHAALFAASRLAVGGLDRLGLKRRIKKLLRRGS